MPEELPMKRNLTTPLSALVLAALLAGCASSVKLDEVPVETRNPTGTASGAGAGTSAATAGTGQSSVTTVDLARSADAAAAGAGRIVYFDFDSYVIKDDYKALVEAHAKALGANRSKKMTVEGHTDERGGSEYNLALGQKRAEAVVRSLTLLGAGADQLEPVSFGKERPAVQGSDEAAWAKNRRAELKDR
jgi:peptidoglycan-associated lipoprotein